MMIAMTHAYMISIRMELYSGAHLIGHGQQTREKRFEGEWPRLNVKSWTLTATDSGKTLGGSSSINGGHWTRGLAAQYDAWSSLLEPSEASVGWNWQNLFGYMKKVCQAVRHTVGPSHCVECSFRRRLFQLPMPGSSRRAPILLHHTMERQGLYK
jgi:choline dehydrogenase-like flavoprotein